MQFEKGLLFSCTHTQGKEISMNTRPAAPKLINFCQVPLTKHVECSSVCADDHHVDNLVAEASTSSFQTSPRGFRVEHFVRPPVHLDFSFLAPIDVACVVVKPDLGDEDSAATFTVSATAGSGSHTRHEDLLTMGRGSVRGEGALLLLKNRVFERRYGCRVDLRSFTGVVGSRLTGADTAAAREPTEDSLKDVRNVRHLRLTVNYFSGPRPVSLELVEVWGKLGTCVSKEDWQKAIAVLATLEEKVPAVITPRDGVVLMYKAGSRPSPERGLSDYHLCEKSICHSPCPLDGKGREGSVKAAAFSLTVSKNESAELRCNSTSVCQWDERKFCAPSQRVWSQGALSKVGAECPTQQSSQELNFSGGPSSATGHGAGWRSSSYGTRPNESGGRETNSVSVPERFLDEITCEIMVLPTLLPSGHFVDRSTLDKLHTTDCVYGRPPSDPFTGVPFSEHAEPQFSVELKQQIDSFISRHGSDVFRDKSTDSSSLGQTLGSAAEIALHLSSAKPPGAGQKRGRVDGAVSDSLSLPPPTKRLAVDNTATLGRGPVF
jgi:hypothetical protein